MMPHSGYRWATLAVALAACLLALALASCGNDNNDSIPESASVEAVVAQYQRLDVTDQEVDEFRQGIDDALATLPASERDGYLDTLYQSTKDMADTVEDIGSTSTDGTTPPEGGGM